MMRKVWVCCLALFLGLSAGAAERIEAWSYYPSPPFQTDAFGNEGLARDTVDYLNKALAGKYEIQLVLLPRARLNMMLENGERGMVLFAPSAIFGGLGGRNYLWTGPLIEDGQALVSLKSKAFEFTDEQSLGRARFAGMLGHVFPQIQTAVEAGRIRVDRATSESSLVSMLLFNHVDVITLPYVVAQYMTVHDPALRDGNALYFSRRNLGTFTRHLMFQSGMTQARDDFDRAVSRMPADPRWQAILARYGLEPIRRSVAARPASLAASAGR